MSRVQLALKVTDVNAAVEFYTKLFGAEPAKRRDGYANFSIAEPPLKLVLIESEQGGTLDHLGIEVAGTDEVEQASTRIHGAGLAPGAAHEVECCYARQEKFWIEDPDGAPWEVYTVLGDSPRLEVAGCC